MAVVSKSRLTNFIRAKSGMHVTASAGDVALSICEVYLSVLITEAGANAKHAGRKTINESDIRKAYKSMRMASRLVEESASI